MDIRQLRETLEQIRNLHTASGANSQANDFQKVIEILDGHEDETISEFVKKTKALLRKPVKKITAKLDENTVRGHVKNLESAKTDRKSFEHAYDLLVADRKVRKIEVEEIAKRYSGYSMNLKSRKKALEEIRAKFTEIASLESRMSIIDKITPW